MPQHDGWRFRTTHAPLRSSPPPLGRRADSSPLAPASGCGRSSPPRSRADTRGGPPPSVEDLELPLGGLKPFQTIAVEHDRQPALGVRLELLRPVKATPEAAEHVAGHVAFIRRR